MSQTITTNSLTLTNYFESAQNARREKQDVPETLMISLPMMDELWSTREEVYECAREIG